MTAPSENVGVKLNTTVYGNVVINKKNICTQQADPLFHVDKLKINDGTKINKGTFRIDKNV